MKSIILVVVGTIAALWGCSNVTRNVIDYAISVALKPTSHVATTSTHTGK